MKAEVYKYEQWSRVRLAGPNDAICLPSVHGLQTQHPSSTRSSLVSDLRETGTSSWKNSKHSLDTHLLPTARVTKLHLNSGIVPLRDQIDSHSCRPGGKLSLAVRSVAKTPPNVCLKSILNELPAFLLHGAAVINLIPLIHTKPTVKLLPLTKLVKLHNFKPFLL